MELELFLATPGGFKARRMHDPNGILNITLPLMRRIEEAGRQQDSEQQSEDIQGSKWAVITVPPWEAVEIRTSVRFRYTEKVGMTGIIESLDEKSEDSGFKTDS